MPVHAPLDVDLEDRLIYGLTPIRFGYLAAAVMAGLAIWSSHWLPVLVRAPLAFLAAAIGAALAWGRYRGRPFDAWISDGARYIAANYRLELEGELRARLPDPKRLRQISLFSERRSARATPARPDWIDAYCSPGLDPPP